MNAQTWNFVGFCAPGLLSVDTYAAYVLWVLMTIIITLLSGFYC